MEEKLEKYIGVWMKNSWSKRLDSRSLVGDDAYERATTGLPLAVCVGIENDYLVMKCHDGIFHVKFWDGINIMPTPKFVWGDQVQEVERSEVRGYIVRIGWHDKDQEYKYYIKIKGKTKDWIYKSRRYNENELKLQSSICE